MLQDAGLQDKIAIVTGGARGIGREVVKVLASQGMQVYFLYHASQTLAMTLAEECSNVYPFCVDVRDHQHVQATIEEIEAKTQRIDILVNNSGIVKDNLFSALSDEDIDDVIDVNLRGVFNVTRAVVPFMSAKRQGKIINISSVAAEKGGKGQTNYAASKGAINAFTKSLAVELAKRKITVNAVAPGVVETEMSQMVRDMGDEEARSKILLGRYAKPEEVAYVVAFLASRYADYITGEIIHIDGGFKMA
jgi:3-oxoacyl-[acyl-carrier protein] reductase